MKCFDISDNHNVSVDIEKTLSHLFGGANKVKDNHYVVNDPIYDVINKIEVIVYDDELCLDISEVSFEKAYQEELFNEVPEVIASKNELLRLMTGKTVSDRKYEMRKDVMCSNLTYSHN